MDTIIINVDSKDRDKVKYPLSTKFMYKINEIKNVIEIKLSSIRIPNTAYTISEYKKNNVIYFNDNELIIEDGIYDVTNLLNEINGFLNTLSGDLIVIDLNNVTGKTRIFSESNFTVYIPKLNSYDSLANILGFAPTDEQGNVSLTGNNIYIAENMFNVYDNLYYLMRLNDIGKVYSKNIRYFAKILARMSKTFIDFEGSHEYVSKSIVFDQPINLDYISVEIHDYLNNLVNLNGLEIDFSLEIKFINNKLLKQYKELNFYDENLMQIVLNDQMLKYYVDMNKKVDNMETYDNILQNNIINNPNVNISMLKPSVDDTIDIISKNYDSNDLKKIEIEDKEKRQNRINKRKNKKISNKFKY